MHPTPDDWLSKRRQDFIQLLLTLGPILGIVLAFISNVSERGFLAESLVILVISSMVAYFILAFDFNQRIWRLYYSVAAVGIASGFSFLLRLTASFYGDVSSQNLVFVASFVLLSIILVAPFRPPRIP